MANDVIFGDGERAPRPRRLGLVEVGGCLCSSGKDLRPQVSAHDTAYQFGPPKIIHPSPVRSTTITPSASMRSNASRGVPLAIAICRIESDHAGQERAAGWLMHLGSRSGWKSSRERSGFRLGCVGAGAADKRPRTHLLGT